MAFLPQHTSFTLNIYISIQRILPHSSRPSFRDSTAICWHSNNSLLPLTPLQQPHTNTKENFLRPYNAGVQQMQPPSSLCEAI